jgi:hypothetical protein
MPPQTTLAAAAAHSAHTCRGDHPRAAHTGAGGRTRRGTPDTEQRNTRRGGTDKGLFNRTAQHHLASGPELLVPATQVDAVTDLVHRYDPHVTVRRDRFFFDNGVFLYGPVATETPGMVGYYARTASLPARHDRPKHDKLVEGERLVRGLAARLGAQNGRPRRGGWSGANSPCRPGAESGCRKHLDLEVAVYAPPPTAAGVRGEPAAALGPPGPLRPAAIRDRRGRRR